MSNVVTPVLDVARVGSLPRSILNRITWWPSAGIVVAMVALLWFPRLNGPIDLRYDAGVYYVLGSSMASGEGYRIKSEPGAPEGIQYPPGLPALVAVHQLVLGTADAKVVAPVLRRTYAVLFVAFGIATLALARRYVGPVGALLATAVCLFQANTFLLSDMLFTELPYALVSVILALVLVDERMKERPATREAFGFGLAAAGFMLRTAGIALLAAWVMEALLQRQWRIATGRALLAAMPFLLWQVHVMRVQASDEYRQPAYEYQRAPYQYYNVSYADNLALEDPFVPELGRVDAGILIRRVGLSLLALPKSLGEVVSEAHGFWSAGIDQLLGVKTVVGQPYRKVVYLPLFALAMLVVMGLLTFGRQREWFVFTFCGASLLLVCTTPWPSQFLRYLNPLTPFLALAAVLGGLRVIRWATTRDQLRRVRWVPATVVGGLLFATGAVQGYAVYNSFLVRHHSVPVEKNQDKTLTSPKWFYHERNWAGWGAAVEWIGQHAERGAIVATDSPHLCYLRTGHLAIMPPMSPDPREVLRLLDDAQVKYVVIDSLEFIDVARRYTLPAMLADPSRWQPVHRVDQTIIYERIGQRVQPADIRLPRQLVSLP